MKKLLFTLLLVVTFVFNSQAQEESKGFKGAWWGLAAGSYTEDEVQGHTEGIYTILPAVGTFISPTVTVGGAVGYTNASVFGADEGIFIVKPLIRKYWGVSDKFFLFGEANVPLLFGENFNGYGFNIEPGIDFFIGGKWTIEAKFGRIGYNVKNLDGGGEIKSTFVGFNMFDNNTQESYNMAAGQGGGLSLGLKYLF